MTIRPDLRPDVYPLDLGAHDLMPGMRIGYTDAFDSYRRGTVLYVSTAEDGALTIEVQHRPSDPEDTEPVRLLPDERVMVYYLRLPKHTTTVEEALENVRAARRVAALVKAGPFYGLAAMLGAYQDLTSHLDHYFDLLDTQGAR